MPAIHYQHHEAVDDPSHTLTNKQIWKQKFGTHGRTYHGHHIKRMAEILPPAKPFKVSLGVIPTVRDMTYGQQTGAAVNVINERAQRLSKRVVNNHLERYHIYFNQAGNRLQKTGRYPNLYGEHAQRTPTMVSNPEVHTAESLYDLFRKTHVNLTRRRDHHANPPNQLALRTGVKVVP